MEKYGLFIIGGGPAGYEAALEAASCGISVCLAEEDALGGVCLNRGCIPTKTLLRSARLYREVLEGGELGVRAVSLETDIPAFYDRCERVKETLRAGIAGLLQRGRVTLLPCRARVAAPGVVEAGGERYEAENILLATGSRPVLLPIPGAEDSRVVTSDGLLAAPADSKSIIVIGGGVVGVEFAEFYLALGREVTVIEALPRLLARMEDRELGQSVALLLKKKGAQIYTAASVKELISADEGVECRFEAAGKPASATGGTVLMCTGRRPNTEGLLPEELSGLLERGYVRTDADGRTTVPGLWAAGDIVAGSMQLAHEASARAKRAVRLMAGENPPPAGPIPACVFTSPEIAVVGLTPDRAKAEGIPVRVRKSLTSANGRSLVEGSERGFARLVFHAESGALAGAQLMCAHASEMIGGLTAALRAGLGEEELAGTVWPHPTVSEILSF